jgi:hypothetical protein
MSSLARLALFLTLIVVLAPRLSRSQSACVESRTLNATLCYWDVFNHSTVTAPAIVGVTVLPLLLPNRARLFASLNGGPLLPLSAAAAAIAVPPPDAVHGCDSECSGDTVPLAVTCCAMVIDIWFISNDSRSNTGCSLYFTVPAQAAPASLHPILKFHGEINSGLQVSAFYFPPSLPPPLCGTAHRRITAHTRGLSPLHVPALLWSLVPCHLPRRCPASPLQRSLCTSCSRATSVCHITSFT